MNPIPPTVRTTEVQVNQTGVGCANQLLALLAAALIGIVVGGVGAFVGFWWRVSQRLGDNVMGDIGVFIWAFWGFLICFLVGSIITFVILSRGGSKPGLVIIATIVGIVTGGIGAQVGLWISPSKRLDGIHNWAFWGFVICGLASFAISIALLTQRRGIKNEVPGPKTNS